jgi:RNA polymerase sigma-70 factor (sigma-E family)
MRGPSEAEFSELVAARSHALRRIAYLMCGDWHQAEDMVQDAFFKLYTAWHRVQAGDGLDAYLRTILIRTCIDERRRGWWRRESPSAVVPDVVDHATGSPSGDREMLVAGLRKLAAGQRAVLVLRFWEDLSVEETAGILGCSVGTVKSQTSRGLAALRAVIASPAQAASPEDGRRRHPRIGTRKGEVS